MEGSTRQCGGEDDIGSEVRRVSPGDQTELLDAVTELGQLPLSLTKALQATIKVAIAQKDEKAAA